MMIPLIKTAQNKKSQTPESASGFLIKPLNPVRDYSHAAPTIMSKMNNTTIKAKPPPYPRLITSPPYVIRTVSYAAGRNDG
ncbi:hypothetical protein SAMN05421743_11646 [Thalassobacillus cyri]|uniref:Uncharacterized protein n=1 Tax=Thalassobacillus cyri TaxID=571932 RepID=A0A1H4GIG6_9BACI|nr:hypothetical protein SAMN05421743_11646 [Thalassobacillus cyri]